MDGQFMDGLVVTVERGHMKPSSMQDSGTMTASVLGNRNEYFSLWIPALETPVCKTFQLNSNSFSQRYVELIIHSKDSMWVILAE